MDTLSQPSITSLLNSLHTHLQSQTQLLPTLHGQLGLPPTALADELLSLQQTLTRCVEDQIDGRRKQVDEWLSKCEGVEKECHRYGVALGGHIKGPGSTVGEARKEHVLPKRYDVLTELQEKLRQLYHTKYEQLLTLTNRIAVISRTLGEEFFAEDVLEPKVAGEGNLLNAANVQHRDVTPERFSKLEKELVRGKGEVAKRVTQLQSIFVQIDWLYTELGIAPPSVADFPPDSNTASTSSLHLSALSRPITTRTSNSNLNLNADPFLSDSLATPTPASRSRPRTPALFLTSEPDPPETPYELVFARFAARLEAADSEGLVEGRTIGLEGVEPTPGLLAWAEGVVSDLEDTKRRREGRIQAMYDQLEGLWRRLGVPDSAMDGFVDAHRGSTEDTEQAYDEELERMLELKREMMGTFVQNARDEISKLWEELMVGDEEREDFAPFFDDEHTEELLTIHEDEIKRLKDERRMKAHLLSSIRKYFDICEEEKELASAATDQNRLLGRGPRDPGRLLREEKMRKRVHKEKPRLEQDLLASIPAWEAEAGRPFLVHGASMLQILLEAAGVSSDKENARRKPGQRAGSVPPRATTPSNSNSTHAPGYSHHLSSSSSSSGKGSITPAVRPASSQGLRSVPQKRPRLGDATAAYRNAPGNPPVPRIRPPSPGRIAMPKPVSASLSLSTSTSASSLPRPTRNVSAPRPGTQHHTLGIGRAPARALGASVGPGTYRHAPRTASSTTAVYRAAPKANPQVLARKASRARRESFKPRPSIDGAWASGAPGGRYAGFGGPIVKEEEDY